MRMCFSMWGKLRHAYVRILLQCFGTRVVHRAMLAFHRSQHQNRWFFSPFAFALRCLALALSAEMTSADASGGSGMRRVQLELIGAFPQHGGNLGVCPGHMHEAHFVYVCTYVLRVRHVYKCVRTYVYIVTPNGVYIQVILYGGMYVGHKAGMSATVQEDDLNAAIDMGTEEMA